jgi:hypothetical protein
VGDNLGKPGLIPHNIFGVEILEIKGVIRWKRGSRLIS